MTAAAMATMATVEKAKSTRPFYLCDLFAETYAASGTRLELTRSRCLVWGSRGGEGWRS
jgi:hypothetical protein